MDNIYIVDIPMPSELVTDDMVCCILKNAFDLIREGYKVQVNFKNNTFIRPLIPVDKSTLL